MHTANPVLVEVWRGRRVESAHRGAYAVIDGDGRVVEAVGDIARPVYPRSAVKVMQALSLVESGAVEGFDLAARHLALLCGSHSGEPAHVAAVEEILARANLGPDDLACGAHWPLSASAGHALSMAGLQPTALHNNCSGKHAGFLCLARVLGAAPQGYLAASHAVQRAVRETLASVTGFALTEDDHGVDGCSVPTWALPVEALARGYARLGAGTGLGGRGRVEAARRLLDAAMAEPFDVAGTGRFCTRVMTALEGKGFVKVGAEGVYCGTLPGLGLGIALKMDDGGTRAAEVVMAALLARHLGDVAEAALSDLRAPMLHNWNGLVVGQLHPVGPLAPTVV